jgi:hypothetical protein
MAFIFILSMDGDLFKVIVIVGTYITILDVLKIHRDYVLRPETIANIYLHHILIASVIIGSFFKNIFLSKIHLVSCMCVSAMWFWNGGCIMTRWQCEDIPYTKRDLIEIVEQDGNFTHQLMGHLIVILPVILYDFYKLLK